MPTKTAESIHDLARRLLAAGISVIPIRLDKPKAAAIAWEPYETRRPTEAEIRSWWQGRRRGIAAIGGAVSGGLECLDFDEPGLFERWADDVDQAAPMLLARLVIVKTPKGGAHCWFRSDFTEPNQALASRPPSEDELRERPKMKSVKRIETRGAGGYALLPGCPPECHESGNLYVYSPLGLGDLAKVQKISEQERTLLVDLCRSFNALPEPPKGQTAPPRSNGLSPGDDFDVRGDWQQVLEPNGWRLEKGTWDDGRLTRPGKNDGVSATIGSCRGPQGEPLLHVFSSAAGIEPGTYGRFRALTILSHNGDYSAAAKALAASGYGSVVHNRAPAGPNCTTAPTQPWTPWSVKPAGDGPPSGFNAADLVAQEFPPAKFAVEGILCEGLNILGGKPKGGKSWLSLLISWAVAGGHDLDGRKVMPGPVLCLALEDSFRRLQSRLKMLSPAVDWPMPAGLDLRTSWPRSDKGGLWYLVEWIDANPGARLIVIDTLAKFRRSQKGAGNTYSEDYEALGDIQEFAKRYNVPVLLVHHTRKLRAEDPFDELSGTLAISGAADGLLILDRDRGADQGKLYVTGRDVPEATIPLKLDRVSFRWTLEASVEGIDTTGRHVSTATNKVEACCQWLREFLKDYAYPSTEIVKAARDAGFGFDALKHAKAKLGKSGTAELTNANFGGQGVNDWWSGLGPFAGWTRRPEELAGAKQGRPGGDRGETGGDRGAQKDEIGPDLWPGH